MQKPHLIFLQLLGIFVLLCGYFLNDAPDSASVMHFDLKAEHTISAKHKSAGSKTAGTSLSHDDRGPHKFRSGKHFSFKVVLPRTEIVPHFEAEPVVLYTYPLHETYFYLFSKEINPPPPKVC